eukprot:COSAG02_NODE_2774_length_8057_cov_4.361146_7_plen_203_part_00
MLVLAAPSLQLILLAMAKSSCPCSPPQRCSSSIASYLVGTVQLNSSEAFDGCRFSDRVGVAGVLHEGERSDFLRAHQHYPHELLDTTRRLRQLLEISVFVGACATFLLSAALPGCLRNFKGWGLVLLLDVHQLLTVTSAGRMADISCVLNAWHRLCAVVGLRAGAIVTGMLSWHMYLCATAQTSVEYRGNQFRGNLVKTEDG